MIWVDWLIIILPTLAILGVGLYSRKYVRGVADFLAAGRICGRYVISVGDIANALSIIGLASYVEVTYKTGFALSFWQNAMMPLGIAMSLTGYCVYRFRETKAMSLGQFLEMRYSRKLRIFAAALRSLSEMLANMIMPAIASRFFIYYLGLPMSVNLFGLMVPTFMLIVLLCLAIAISLICFGGTLALVITDAIQGMIVFPLIAVFVIYILVMFSWSDQIVPVMTDRVAGESFLNPYDLSQFRDFNLFMVVVALFGAIFHRASWIGAGTTSAAKSSHEQKMAGLLGTWRGSITTVFYVLIGIMIITLMNHQDWAPTARGVRENISYRISEEMVPDLDRRIQFNERISMVSDQIHQIGVDAPLSQTVNLDSPTLNSAHESFKEYEGESLGNAKFQQFRTLYHQMMLAVSVREMLPPILTGLFCLLMILAMISTDDTRIFSATITITQDVIMPLRKKPFAPRKHMWVLRFVSMGVGVFFFCGSFFMAQLDYIQLFVTMMVTMWMGGCGPVMIFGMYGRFGTTAGAFTSLITGMLLAFASIFVQRNWAAVVYPWLDKMDWVERVGHYLEGASAPFAPYIVWTMDPVKFPINSYEIFFLIQITTLILYCVVSKLTQKEPFNLDRMLHRGIYNLDGEKKIKIAWSLKTVCSKLVGITSEYTRGDKVIAWSLMAYSIGFCFVLSFLAVFVWNAFAPWPIQWWSTYFFIVTLAVPGFMAVISTFWFGIGGVRDLIQLFRDLEKRIDNPLDDGWVEGHVSLADKAEIEKLEKLGK